MPTLKPTPRRADDVLAQTLLDIVMKALEAVMPRVQMVETRAAELERDLAELKLDVARLTMQQESEDMTEGLILNVSQVAKALGVSRPTVYRLVESGQLPAKKLSTGPETTSRTVVLAEDLKQFLANLPPADGGDKDADA